MPNSTATPGTSTETVRTETGRPRGPGGAYIENEIPQPQLAVALGLFTTNRAPINSCV